MTRYWLAAIVAAALASGCSAPADDKSASGSTAGSGVTSAMLASPPDGEWLGYGRDHGEQRFSPLAQITDRNVGQLGLAWSAELETDRGQEATPLMHAGVLYVSTAWSMVKAYDAATGQLKWSYDPKVPRDTLVRACCDAVNRGVALYGGKVFVAALDGRLIALNAIDGSEAWSKTIVPDQENYTITGAPRIAKGKVVIGSAGADYKARGFIAAFDADSGAEAWRFHTVPGDPAKGFENMAMEQAAKTWGGEWWKLGGGGAVWDSITYDPATNLILFGTGNAEPWNPAGNGRDRAPGLAGQAAGDNLYTSSIVAVNADTGAYAWHFQETPEDRWDYDSNAQIVLADLTIGGRLRHVAIHAPKNGFVYVLDAATGAYISAANWVQQNWATGLDPVTGRARINPAARYERTGKPYTLFPGAMGAHSWHPVSFSPATGLLYIPTLLGSTVMASDEGWEASDMGFQTGLDPKIAAAAPPPPDPAAAARPGGALIAWDPVAGKQAWRVDFAGRGAAGTLATAGNLVFHGNTGQDLVAYSADKGAKLWSFATGRGIVAAPMTYSVDDKQYVAILTGKSQNPATKGRLLVFALGAKGTLPPQALPTPLALNPPPFTGTAAQVARGAELYGRYCYVCHGRGAVSFSANPDLRHSGAIASPEAIKAVLIDGALSHSGMAGFAWVMSAQDAESVRQYLIKRANDDKALAAKSRR